MLDEAFLMWRTQSSVMAPQHLSLNLFVVISGMELNLTASAGIAPIKFLAKVASIWISLTGQIRYPSSTRRKRWSMNYHLKDPLASAKVSIEKLHQAGFFTCKDIKSLDHRDLLLKFVVRAPHCGSAKCCIDEREVAAKRAWSESLLVGVVPPKTYRTYAECWQVIEDKLFPELETRLEKASLAKRSISRVSNSPADFQQTNYWARHYPCFL